MIFFSFMVVTPLLPLYLSETFEADKDTIGFVLSGYTLTALLARPIAGYLVDSFSRKMVLLICYFLFFAFFAGYLIAGTMTLFAIIRTMHGAPMGAVTVANSTSAIDVLPSFSLSPCWLEVSASLSMPQCISPPKRLFLTKTHFLSTASSS